MKTVIVIPTYNESENIVPLIRRILALGDTFHALVVDDESPDGTAEQVRSLQAEEPRVHLVVRSAPRGLGLAVREGFQTALNLGADCIGQMDADGSHDPIMFLDMRARLVAGEADVIIGSRYLPDSQILGWGLHRHANSQVANRLTRWMTRLPVADATNGLRLFRREVVENLCHNGLRSTGYSIILETNYRAYQMGYQLSEIPITFHPRAAGQSKMGVREIVRFCLFLASLRMNPPTRTIVQYHRIPAMPSTPVGTLIPIPVETRTVRR